MRHGTKLNKSHCIPTLILLRATSRVTTEVESFYAATSQKIICMRGYPARTSRVHASRNFHLSTA